VEAADIEGVTGQWSRAFQAVVEEPWSSTKGWKMGGKHGESSLHRSWQHGRPDGPPSLQGAASRRCVRSVTKRFAGAGREGGGPQSQEAAEPLKDDEIVSPCCSRQQAWSEGLQRGSDAHRRPKGALLIDCSDHRCRQARAMSRPGQRRLERIVCARCCRAESAAATAGNAPFMVGGPRGVLCQGRNRSSRKMGQEHRLAGESGSGQAPKDLQQNDPRHLHGGGLRGLHCWARRLGARRARSVQRRLDGVRLVLVAGKLLARMPGVRCRRRRQTRL